MVQKLFHPSEIRNCLTPFKGSYTRIHKCWCSVEQFISGQCKYLECITEQGSAVRYSAVVYREVHVIAVNCSAANCSAVQSTPPYFCSSPMQRNAVNKYVLSVFSLGHAFSLSCCSVVLYFMKTAMTFNCPPKF